MNKSRNVLWIPILYIVVLVAANIIGAAYFVSSTIVDEDLLRIRTGSITNLAFYGSLFVFYIVLFLPAWKRTFTRFKEKFGEMMAYILAGSGAMFATMIAMGYIYLILNVTEQAENQAILEAQLSGPLFDRVTLVVFAVLLAPFVEEMVFRLAGFRLLKRFPVLPKWSVIIITSLLFGLIHVLGDNLIQVIYYAGLGVVLGILYDRSKNILVPIGVHVIFNGVITILMFLGI